MAPLSRVHEAYRLRDGPYVADLVQRAARRRTAAVRLRRDVARDYTKRSMGQRPWRDMIRGDFRLQRQSLDTATLRRLIAATEIRMQMQRFVRGLRRKLEHVLFYRDTAEEYLARTETFDEPWRTATREDHYTELDAMQMFQTGYSREVLRRLMVATHIRLQLQRFVTGLRRLVARANRVR